MEKHDQPNGQGLQRVQTVETFFRQNSHVETARCARVAGIGPIAEAVRPSGTKVSYAVTTVNSGYLQKCNPNDIVMASARHSLREAGGEP